MNGIRSRAAVIWLHAAALASVAFALTACASEGPKSAIPGQTAPDFTLTDQDGRPFTLSAQRGKAVVLFFGYTHCPDICPATLAKVERAVTLLGPDADRVRVAFITVDPQRDTPRALSAFVRLFGDNVVGLGGSERSLKPVERAYHAWYQRLPSKSAAGYLIAHSSEIYVIDSGGRLASLVDWSDSTDTLVADLRKSV